MTPGDFPRRKVMLGRAFYACVGKIKNNLSNEFNVELLFHLEYSSINLFIVQENKVNLY